MTLLFSLSTITGLILVVASIGDEAVGLGVAALLVAIGAMGKAWIEGRNAGKASTRHDGVVDLAESIRADIMGIRSDVSRIEVDLGQRLTALEDAITAPPASDR